MTEVVAENIILLSSPGGTQSNSEYGVSTASSSAPEPSESAPAKTRKSSPKQEEDITIEDIPF